MSHYLRRALHGHGGGRFALQDRDGINAVPYAQEVYLDVALGHPAMVAGFIAATERIGEGDEL